jgi:hypothetical protein
LLNDLTAPVDDKVAIAMVEEMWNLFGCKPKSIRIMDCPVKAAAVFKKSTSEGNEKLVKSVVREVIKTATESIIEIIGHDAEKETIDSERALLANDLRKIFHVGVIHENQSNSTTNTLFNVMLRVDTAAKEASNEKLDDEFFCPGYMRTYAAYYAICQKYDLLKPSKEIDLFTRFVNAIHTVFIDAENPIIVRSPVRIVHNDTFISNDTGPSFQYKDGLTLWIIDDLVVDEQLIMRPETQTIKQIEAEENADIRSIRISRYTWLRYLREIGAETIDYNENAVEGTIEALYVLSDKSKRLVVTCPTGRPFAMGVPQEIVNCQQARTWLAGDIGVNIIGAT